MPSDAFGRYYTQLWQHAGALDVLRGKAAAWGVLHMWREAAFDFLSKSKLPREAPHRHRAALAPRS